MNERENTGFYILEKVLSAEETHHTATADSSSSDNTGLIQASLSFAGFPRTNWCYVKVCVAEEDPRTLPGPLL